jgi:hypothetical protein
MMVDGTAFVADQVAAVVVGAYVEISARSVDQAIVLALPATPGDYSCADTMFAGQIAYYPDAATEFHNRLTQPRPACSASVVAVGSVGARIEGSFSATVTGTTSLALTNGTFSVERIAFP